MRNIELADYPAEGVCWSGINNITCAITCADGKKKSFTMSESYLRDEVDRIQALRES